MLAANSYKHYSPTPSMNFDPNYRPEKVHKPVSKFKIKGVEIEATSKKDAIKKYNHQYKNKK